MEDYHGGGGGSSDEGETNGDIYQDMRDFDKRLKTTKDDPFFNNNHDSSDEDHGNSGGAPAKRLPMTELDILKEKNRVLMEKLFKADKQINEYKEIIETVSSKTSQSDNLKDKKILDLAKKNRTL